MGCRAGSRRAGELRHGSPTDRDTEAPVALRRLLIELLQPFPAEIDVKDFITGLWSLGMASRPGASARGRCQRSRAAQAPVHQGKSATGDERKADQVNSSQKVVQGTKMLSITLV